MQLKKTAGLLARIVLPVVFVFICIELLMIVFDPYLFKGFYEFDCLLIPSVLPFGINKRL